MAEFSFYKDKNILVTGGAGFIPSHLVDNLVALGSNVRVIDNLSAGNIKNLEQVIDKIHFEERNICDYKSIKNLFKDVDLVFHLAANANVPFSVDNPEIDFSSNSEGSFNVYRACVAFGVKKIVYASSAAVYGTDCKVPISENSILKPVSPYGASKLSGEVTGFAMSKTYDFRFTAFRIFNTYGERQPRYVIYDLIKKLNVDPHNLEVLGTGDQIRDYIHVSDTARAFLFAGFHKNSNGKVYNLAGGHPTSIKQLTRKIIETMQLDTKVNYTGKSWKGDIINLTADIEKIKLDLGFIPKISFEEGIIRTTNWLNDNLK